MVTLPRLQKYDQKREREQHCGGECCSAVEAGWLGQAGQWCRCWRDW